MSTEQPERVAVDDALAQWEEKGPTSLVVAMVVDALYGVRESGYSVPGCEHDQVRTFRSIPPHTKCVDCGAVLERRWVSKL